MIPALTFVLTFICLLLLFGFDCYLAAVAASSASRPAIIAAHTYRREREGESPHSKKKFWVIAQTRPSSSQETLRPLRETRLARAVVSRKSAEDAKVLLRYEQLQCGCWIFRLL